jgi:hypothetical protein
VLTIGGAFLGWIATLDSFFTIRDTPLIGYGIMIIFVALYGYGIFAGIRFTETTKPDIHLFLYYLLQIPFISSPFVVFRFGSGLQTTVAIIGFRLAWILHLGSDWQFALLSPNQWGLGLNLFPLCIILVLYFCAVRQLNERRSFCAANSKSDPPRHDY